MENCYKIDSSYKNFEGQTTDEAASLINILHQKVINNKIKSGKFFESGTFKGLSACIFLSLDYIIKGYLVDVAQYLEIEKLKKFSRCEFEFIKTKSEDFDYKNLGAKKSFTWAHLDSSHRFENVKNEIINIVPYMNEFGLICLDDWNDIYSQVRAAYYYLHFKELIDWELVLTGFNKAFLCKTNNFKYFHNQLIDIFSNSPMVDEKILDWEFARTENHKFSRGFHLRHRHLNSPMLYGTNFNGNQFYQKISDS